jgi:hypothetical protein
MKVNEIFFDQPNEDALRFYKENGFVCFSSVVDLGLCRQIEKAWATLVKKYAREIGIQKESYLREISQWRDLWKQNEVFHGLLANHLCEFAAFGLELPGSRLIHDHFIRKSQYEGNGEIPWHQDSMYWPVDRTGCSTWLAIDDARIDSGCLEVSAGSHLGETGNPVDFMNNTVCFAQDRITAIPVCAGDVVLMNSKTWHRSMAAKVGVRLAHIALWVPPSTRYDPDKASWHPLNRQVSVSAGYVLNNDEFPVFGDHTERYGNSEVNDHGGVIVAQGMFNARSSIEKYVQEFVGSSDSLGKLLADSMLRERLALEFCRMHTHLEPGDCRRVIERVWISAAAYELHRSRNVYSSAYQSWHACLEYNE